MFVKSVMGLDMSRMFRTKAGVVFSIAVVACGGGGDAGVDASANPDGAPSSTTLSAQHLGDVGLGSDPAVVWYEDFEAATVAAVTGRYDQTQGTARMAKVAGSTGMGLALTAGGAVSAVDLYKQLPNHDELFVRWYANYQAGVPWHHSGMWIGGYNPAMAYPSPQAGNKPVGNDRFSLAVEPVYGVGAANPRFDFYNYWMAMHSWMATPTNDGTSYYGNGLVHQNGFTIDEGNWVCLEVHVKLNPNPTTGAGAVLEVWKNDAPVIRFDDSGPLGYWIRDKFCPTGANGSECTDYPAPATEHLDLQLRSTAALALNAFWPQNYVTDAAQGTLTLDQMVVATARVGCTR